MTDSMMENRWFSIIKQQLHERWNQLYLSEEHTFTLFGNVRSPGYFLCIKWLSEIWSAFPEYHIIKSFEKCGVTSAQTRRSSLQSILNTKQTLNNYIDQYHEADDIDGFNDVNLFDIGSEEVLDPLPSNREIQETDSDEKHVDLGNPSAQDPSTPVR